jgi:tetratricopeptide (TPR) repeat protein
MRLSALVAAALAAVLAPSPARAAPHLSPAVESRLDEGLRRLYCLDYAKSRAAFRKIIELEPDNPFGYLFEAGGIWWESSQEFGLFKDTPTLQGLFEQDIEAAQRKADVYIDSRNPHERADGYFVSGMALGTLGQWRLMKGHWLDAYFAGKKAVKHLKKCVKLDPEYFEALLGLGVFDYQAAHLSGVAKLGILFGMKGNEKRGLESITAAVEKSRYASRQAAAFLLSIYLIDLHDFARALSVVQILRRSLPESPYYIFIEALLRHRLGDWDGSFAMGRQLFAAAAADPAAFRPKWLTLVCGLSGPSCLAPADAPATLAWLDHALETTAKEKPDAFGALLRLFRGQVLEASGRREEALGEYRKVLALPEFDFTRSRAKACLEAPCPREEQLGLLKRFAQAQ